MTETMIRPKAVQQDTPTKQAAKSRCPVLSFEDIVVQACTIYVEKCRGEDRGKQLGLCDLNPLLARRKMQ